MLEGRYLAQALNHLFLDTPQVGLIGNELCKHAAKLIGEENQEGFSNKSVFWLRNVLVEDGEKNTQT
jgi:hypothetical protein